MKKDNTIEKNKKENKEKKNKKLPKEISQEILKKIFKNLLKAIGVMLYFVVLNLAYASMKHERLIEDIKVFSGAFLLVGLIMLEKAYKEDKGEPAITGIELICLSLHSLSIMHVITMFKYDFRYYLLTSSYVFSIYFVLKSIILYTKERKEYLNSLSDIPEIVKKDEPVKKEAKKRNKEKETMNDKKASEEVSIEKKPKSKRGKSKKEVKEND